MRIELRDTNSEFISFYGDGYERALSSLLAAGARRQLNHFEESSWLNLGSLCKNTFYSMFFIEVTE
jgi:hypothetical protein